MGVAQITNPHGAFDQDPSYAVVAESFRNTGAAIAAGAAVVFTYDISNNEVTVAAGAGTGRALEAIPAGGYGLVANTGLVRDTDADPVGVAATTVTEQA